MKFIAKINEKEIPVEVKEGNGYFIVNYPEGKSRVEYCNSDYRSLSLLLDDKYYNVSLVGQNGVYTADVKGNTYKVEIEEEWKARFSKSLGSKKIDSAIEVKSPMPGKVVRINIEKGDIVKKDQGIIVVEAMKMENELCSPVSGVVDKINVEVGDVAGGQEVLVIITPR